MVSGQAQALRPFDAVLAAPSRPARPAALVIGLLAALEVALLTVTSQALALVDGRETIERELHARVSPEVAAGLAAQRDAGSYQAALDEAFRTIEQRAQAGIVIGFAIVVLVVASRWADRWARFTLAALLLVGAFLMVRSVTDVFPEVSRALGVAGIALVPLVVVLLFLPGVGRYRAASARAAGATR